MIACHADDCRQFEQRATKKDGKCGLGGKRVDVRPNWKEAPAKPDRWDGRVAWEKKWPTGESGEKALLFPQEIHQADEHNHGYSGKQRKCSASARCHPKHN